MSYYDPSSFLDWPLLDGQLQTGLDVQLPGSEQLFSLQDGFLGEQTASLVSDVKRLSDEITAPSEDALNEFNITIYDGIGSSGDVPDDGFDFDFLPLSPEDHLVDINSLAGTPNIEPIVPLKSEGTHLQNSTNGRKIEELSLDVEAIHDLLFDETDGDIDPAEFLSPILPSFPIPSLSEEDVDSLFSDSPLDDSASREFVPDLWSSQFSSAERPSEVPVLINAVVPDVLVVSSTPTNILLSTNAASIKGNMSGTGLDVHAFVPAASVPVAPSFTHMTWQIGSPLPVLGGILHGGDDTASVGSISPPQSPSNSSVSSESHSRCSPSPLAGMVSSEMPSVHSSTRVEPYPTNGVRPERKERKREQNKTAALKYRQKKRTEQGIFVSECDQLEKRNGELKSRVEELTREINYLKGLISEIYSSQAD